jgi:uncharacterized membrane protein
MGKLEYLEQLKRAMLGLPPDVQAKTLGYYDQRFVDGIALGRSEQEVAGELDDPRKIAMTLRTSAHLDKLDQKKHPANLLRMLFSGVGLTIFNLFMIVPAIVYSALLFALYVAALAFYLSGVAITASGLAGANDVVLDWPARFITVDDDGRAAQTRVLISEKGINVTQERARPADEPEAEAEEDKNPPRASRVRRGAEAVAGNTLRITTDMDADSRTTQTVFGTGMVLGGIALFLLSLVVTRYTLVGIKRYVQMNFTLLKGH